MRHTANGQALPKYVYRHVTGHFYVKVTRRPRNYHLGTYRTVDAAAAAVSRWRVANPDKLPRFERY